MRVGVFDSGLGGLSVLRALQTRLAHAHIDYVADSGHAPYGEREGSFIVARSLHIGAFLVSQQVDAIVVACNTATATSVHALRQRHPHLPIIGVEPGVKPAVAASANKRVGVLATPHTLSSQKFQRLIEQHAQGATIVAQPCPGLAAEIERGHLDTPALRELVARFSAPLREQAVDTVVLGCTHYPFVAPLFQAALGPGVTIIDTSEAVAARTADVLSASPHRAARPHAPGIRLWTSASPLRLTEVAHHWLGVTAHATALP